MKTCNFKKVIVLLLAFIALSGPVLAQLPANWQNLDLKKDSIFGISTEKAYDELLKGKIARPVIVAVIDAGIDTTHEDLKAILWHNPKEKPGNRKDDDHNGYVDDVYGWSFLGSAKGNVKEDNIELTRQVRQGYALFGNKDSTSIRPTDWPAYRAWKKEQSQLDSQLNAAHVVLNNIHRYRASIDTIMTTIGTKHPNPEQLQAFFPKTDWQKWMKENLIKVMQEHPDAYQYLSDALNRDEQHANTEVEYQLNINFDPRKIVGDDYFNSAQQKYGTPDVYGPAASHGTHVAGIIAAVRNNKIGINGVADHVQIMTVRVVPEGDERDKDVANGIKYAVDNGAKVINMSFGKGYSQDKHAVDEAVKYAMSHDVLIVHAAGNGNIDLDFNKSYPNPYYEDGSGEAPSWIEVGASGPHFDRQLKAPFSNYGKNTVDVFAPGEKIRSTIPGSKYENYDGTSMAAPVVSGLAALIREYYPKLTAVQVKEIICKSVVNFPHHVFLQKGNQMIPIEFSELSKSGGVVNAFNALKLAATY